jgi:hypothetical protein
MNYEETNTLIPITSLSAKIRINGTVPADNFDVTKYIPVTLIEANKLFVNEKYQRLISEAMIRKAKFFDPKLCRPLYVFKRPNRQLVIADGQHTAIMGILYTAQGGKLFLPCQVETHPSNFSDKQCTITEADRFGSLNVARKNAGQIDTIRADIAAEKPAALKILEKLVDMEVQVENLGHPDGVSVHGYTKLMQSHDKYNLAAVRNAIKLCEKLEQNFKFPKWNNVTSPLNGGLLGGIAAVMHLKQNEIGAGDKHYALEFYLENLLGKTRPDDLIYGTAGTSQAVLIARRIVDKCNAAIDIDAITKKNGDELKVLIGSEIMDNAGLSDPSVMKLAA